MRSDPQVIVLNGGSSSGKSSLARALQDVLPGPWLRLGVDDLIDAMPARLLGPGGLDLSDDGQVGVGTAFTVVEEHWMAGVAAIARHGGQVIVEDNFVSGPAAQRRWTTALSGIETRWVGVRCSAEVAAAAKRCAVTGCPGWPPTRQPRSIAVSTTTWSSIPVPPRQPRWPRSSTSRCSPDNPSQPV
jgi:chloramphenicol 3-O phosphotransferase